MLAASQMHPNSSDKKKKQEACIEWQKAAIELCCLFKFPGSPAF
jgi:hypothetical protein